MDYISNFGQAAGPIKISNTWLSTIIDSADTHNSSGSVVNTYYVVVGDQKQYKKNSNLAPILAGSPVLGTYKDNDTGVTHSCAPANAVATIGWVRAYAELGEGNESFLLDDFVKKDDMESVINRLETAESNVLSLTNRVTTAENTVHNMQTIVNSLQSTVSSHALSIQQNTADITALKTNPFPNGLWLVCGDSAS